VPKCIAQHHVGEHCHHHEGHQQRHQAIRQAVETACDTPFVDRLGAQLHALVSAINFTIESILRFARGRLHGITTNPGLDIGQQDINRLLRIDDQHMRLARRTLEGRELAVDQRNRHEMSRPSAHALYSGDVRDVQVHELQPRNRLAQTLAIGTFERRAGQHEAFTGRLRRQHLLAQRIQPVATVFVAQRDTRTHAFYIFGRMEMIGFDMTPAEGGGDRLADLALAGATDAHDHERGTGRQCGRLLLHGNSMGTIRGGAAHCLSRMLALSKTFDNPPLATFRRAFPLISNTQRWPAAGGHAQDRLPAKKETFRQCTG
jgi:hypothetical protein